MTRSAKLHSMMHYVTLHNTCRSIT